jgi:hypothetical protein
MANLLIGLKKFLQNKNIVTIVGIVLIIAILSFAYSIRVKEAINPVTVPYALEQITSSKQIKKSMIGTMQVPPSMLRNGNVITKVGDVIDKYVSIDTVIPKGSLFYKKAVVSREQMPDDIILDYKEGYQLYYQKVNIENTFGNSIVPGGYVTVQMEARDNDSSEPLVIGNLLSNVLVLAVKDDRGRPVFQNIDENRTPYMVIFAVKEEYFKLLLAAEKLSSAYKVTIKLNPTSKSFDDQESDVIASENLRNWINEHVQYMD